RVIVMAIGFTSPIVCPVLIGRTPHLDTLVQFMEQAYRGQGQTILIAGEAGIGKSRLVIATNKRLLSSAHLTPLVFRGQCYEPDASRPYAPLLDGLRNFFASRSPDELAASLAGGETGRRNPPDFLPYNHKGSPLHFTT